MQATGKYAFSKNAVSQGCELKSMQLNWSYFSGTEVATNCKQLENMHFQRKRFENDAV